MRVLEKLPTTYRRWVNDWGGVFCDASSRFLRNTPDAYAVLAWRDDAGTLQVEQFDTAAELTAREQRPMPFAYAITWRREAR